jgi:hypothetical protein
MSIQTWFKSNVNYSRKLAHSAAEGAHCGEEAFLQGERLIPFVEVAARTAITPAVVGALVGILSGLTQKQRARACVYGLLGGAIGFSAGFVWESRRLTASIANGAWKEIGKTRDEHWFEKNPIDYA